MDEHHRHHHEHTHAVNVTIHADPIFHELLAVLRALHTLGERMSQELDDLSTQVESNTTVIGSALTLIQGLAAQLQAAGTDPAKLKALRDSLATSDQQLAAAVAAGTPAAPPTP